jgi:hypothetical protein
MFLNQASVYEPSTEHELSEFTRRYCELALKVRDLEKAAQSKVRTLEDELFEKNERLAQMEIHVGLLIEVLH